MLRVKVGGGLAGHNGLRSIKQHLHDDAFLRVRIGVGQAGHEGTRRRSRAEPVRQARPGADGGHDRRGRRRGRDDPRRRRRRRDEPLQRRERPGPSESAVVRTPGRDRVPGVDARAAHDRNPCPRRAHNPARFRSRSSRPRPAAPRGPSPSRYPRARCSRRRSPPPPRADRWCSRCRPAPRPNGSPPTCASTSAPTRSSCSRRGRRCRSSVCRPRWRPWVGGCE